MQLRESPSPEHTQTETDELIPTDWGMNSKR